MTRAGFRPALWAVAIAIAAAGCNNPQRRAGLTLPSGSGGTGAGMVSGTVVAYGTTTPIAGATVRLGGVTAVSNTAGEFTLNGVSDSGNGVVTVAAPGYIYRGVAVALAPTRTGVVLDVIPDAPPFFLDFYRQFVRNQYLTGSLQPTARWTVAPNFYFQSLTVDTGVTVPSDIIQSIEANFTLGVPEMSGGRFNVASFVVGDAPMADQDGWVIVTFYTLTTTGFLGSATVGGNSGRIVIEYDPSLASNALNNPYNCASIPLQVADYLITTTMGYYQTANALTDEFSGPGCPGMGRPANTRYHASVMYSRPPGNIDPDVDPASSAQVAGFASAPAAVTRPVVVYDPARIVRRR